MLVVYPGTASTMSVRASATQEQRPGKKQATDGGCATHTAAIAYLVPADDTTTPQQQHTRRALSHHVQRNVNDKFHGFCVYRERTTDSSCCRGRPNEAEGLHLRVLQTCRYRNPSWKNEHLIWTFDFTLDSNRIYMSIREHTKRALQATGSRPGNPSVIQTNLSVNHGHFCRGPDVNLARAGAGAPWQQICALTAARLRCSAVCTPF